jgi:hypothetical protein
VNLEAISKIAFFEKSLREAIFAETVLNRW